MTPNHDPTATHRPTVSVIMIFLDAARYMEAAIDSVFMQTLEDWELILVDDGSRDGSRDIAERYAAADPDRVSVHEHPGRHNLGTGPSRNLGLRAARGRYLCFLDADDVFEPARLERPVAWLDDHPALGVVITAELYWRSWQPQVQGTARWRRLPDEVVRPSAPLSRPIPPPALIAATLATPGAAMPGICSITFRQTDTASIAVIPEAFVSQYEDQALITRLLLERIAVVLPECLSRYRQHPDSLTQRAEARGEYRPGRPHEARSLFLRWLRDYLAERGIDEPVLTEAVDDELARAARNPVRPNEQQGRRGLRRFVLVCANLLLPQALVDAWIGAYLARVRARVDRRAANVARMVTTAPLADGGHTRSCRRGED